jgi:hypothetical protein
VLGNPLPRRLSVAETEAPWLEFDAELSEPLVTLDHTARLQVTWTNSRSQEINIGMRSSSTHEFHVSKTPETRRTGLVLADPDYENTTQTWAGCWQINQMGGPAGGAIYVLEPGESLTHEYAVFKDYQVDDCFPVGEYQFGYVGEDWAESASNSPDPDWRLILAVEKI